MRTLRQHFHHRIPALAQPRQHGHGRGRAHGVLRILQFAFCAFQLSPRALALNVGPIALHVQLGFPRVLGIAAVGVDIFVGIGLVQYRLEHLGVVDRGAGDVDLADEAPAPIRVGVQLVTVVALAVLLRPARIHVLLRALERLGSVPLSGAACGWLSSDFAWQPLDGRVGHTRIA
ncbi:hypothetical protein RHOFW510R12_13325 [Rhodanobacter sp. FW510-R12]|uniref:hypothetical protein n=1 Tax=Rhodanobacter sp. OR444 TaxID=1076525 RepID=UPI0004810F75|nr:MULTISPECIES: hypothetical protein [Rhodanobacter]UJJ53149.1 hypothetical protein LRK53_09010 [Rhodanobacter thiooxydans]